MWEKSSRLMSAPRRRAYANSSAGVSLEENMMSSPTIPSRSQSMSSVRLEQSMPQPWSCSRRRMAGFGQALTA